MAGNHLNSCPDLDLRKNLLSYNSTCLDLFFQENQNDWRQYNWRFECDNNNTRLSKIWAWGWFDNCQIFVLVRGSYTMLRCNFRTGWKLYLSFYLDKVCSVHTAIQYIESLIYRYIVPKSDMKNSFRFLILKYNVWVCTLIVNTK